MNSWMRKFFMYLDRYYVHHENLPPLVNSGITKFKTIVYDVVKDRVVDALLAEINKEREGGIIDKQRVRDCISLLEDIGMATLDVYTGDFEEQLLESTTRYYRMKASEWLDSESTPTYLIRTEEALRAETKRVTEYLNNSTKDGLLRVVETELLKTPGQQLLEKEGSGCRALLANNRLEDLSRMFTLFGQVRGQTAKLAFGGSSCVLTGVCVRKGPRWLGPHGGARKAAHSGRGHGSCRRTQGSHRRERQGPQPGSYLRQGAPRPPQQVHAVDAGAVLRP
eukprot:scaffold48_cov311-Pinguiococcus_pyrenoidosus.AAC.277